MIKSSIGCIALAAFSPVTPSELHRTQCLDWKGKLTDDLGNVRAGSYYLHVITSRPWTLVVEETK